MSERSFKVEPGNAYDMATGAVVEDQPDTLACRRAADYPAGSIPITAMFGRCSACRAIIVFSPRTVEKFPDAPLLCMQCCGIEPEPL